MPQPMEIPTATNRRSDESRIYGGHYRHLTGPAGVGQIVATLLVLPPALTEEHYD
jgi:hypothetical protein